MVHTGGPPCPGRPSLPDRGQWPSPVTCTNLCPGVPAWRCRSHLRGWPVSRILFRGLPPFDDHSSSPALADGIQLPTRASRAEASLRRYPVGPVPREAPIRHCSGRGLPCHSCCQDRGGLLPHRFTITLTGSGAMPGSGLSLLCCAFPRVTPAGGYPAPLLHGVRTFLGTR